MLSKGPNKMWSISHIQLRQQGWVGLLMSSIHKESCPFKHMLSRTCCGWPMCACVWWHQEIWKVYQSRSLKALSLILQKQCNPVNCWGAIIWHNCSTELPHNTQPQTGVVKGPASARAVRMRVPIPETALKQPEAWDWQVHSYTPSFTFRDNSVG